METILTTVVACQRASVLCISALENKFLHVSQDVSSVIRFLRLSCVFLDSRCPSKRGYWTLYRRAFRNIYCI